MSLSDPSGSAALTAAAHWISNTLLGSVATAIAVIAVASVGLLMLSGRIDVRRAATIVVGCFVLFGAPTIVAGIRGAASGLDAAPSDAAAIATPPPQPLAEPSRTAPPVGYDPYAGASVPR